MTAKLANIYYNDHNIEQSISDFYKKASYTLNTGNIVHGEPIYFSVTIPEATASNLPRSISFVNFLLSRDSRYILQSQGLNYIKPLTEGKLDKYLLL